MSLVDRLRPRWKHSDPAVRADGVLRLTDQALLRRLAETDFSEMVQVAAFNQLIDEDVLLELAKGEGRWNLRAADRIADPYRVVEVAREALSARVRETAVARIDDLAVLQGIATSDMDAAVRQRARRKLDKRDRLRDRLEALLSGLEITPLKPDGEAYFRGSLSDVCGALIHGTLHINGVLLPPLGDNPGTAASGLVVTEVPEQNSCCVELVAARDDDTEQVTDPGQIIYYRIKIWRLAADAYQGVVEQRRHEVTPNVVLWSTSSNGGEER